ncbi:Ubiquitin-conjugating enzyme E2 R2 [Takifugu flavidus]|uniref:Ubiquitin-conjugating enzyme E2 R2 n=2 Tax=Percomorphaceae TaxID=1489872 RepID=A0A5C6MRF7_9TELE|nr:Ubiquitin-conjugating enzyme E2 R2 [Takifugu flavidus]
MAQHGHHVASSQKALMLEMKSLQDEPVEGFKITLVDESDMYNWEVAIFGPPNTHYEGGYFKLDCWGRLSPQGRFGGFKGDGEKKHPWHKLLSPPVQHVKRRSVSQSFVGFKKTTTGGIQKSSSSFSETSPRSPRVVSRLLKHQRAAGFLSGQKVGGSAAMTGSAALLPNDERSLSSVVMCGVPPSLAWRSEQKAKRGPVRASRVVFLLRLGRGDTREKGDTEVDEEQAGAVLIAVVLLKGELVVNGGKREAPADADVGTGAPIQFSGNLARIKFPVDYPYSPPAFRFLTKMWHPNIYENGDVCISILHPPVDDPQSGELPSERWNPTQNVRTILLSVISLLNEPNTFSPANVDASVMYRKWRDSKGKDREYIEIIRKQVLATKADADRDGVKVPITLDEYCVRTQVPPTDDGSNLLYDDYYDDEELDDDDDEDDNEDCCYDEDDSGTEDS